MSKGLRPHNARRFCAALPLALLLCRIAPGATAGLSLQPGRLEIEAAPGMQKTVGFEIESPPSDEPVRGRLLLSVTDWDLSEDGALQFQEAGANKMSAARWMTFSPAAISIESGRKQLVRVTVEVPADAAPGVYRAGIFVQERPPATPPKSGEHNILFRFRYMETVYVTVPPVAAKPSLVDAGLEAGGRKLAVFCRMRNDGSAMARPYISWTLRDAEGRIAAQTRSHEATVLLPAATLMERFPLEGIAPGKYEFSATVDFRDDRAVQAITRIVEIAPSAAADRADAPRGR